MKILADRSFERDVKRLPGQAQQRLKGLLQEIAVATTLQDVNATKMEGAKKTHTAFVLATFVLGFIWREIKLFCHGY